MKQELCKQSKISVLVIASFCSVWVGCGGTAVSAMIETTSEVTINEDVLSIMVFSVNPVTSQTSGASTEGCGSVPTQEPSTPMPNSSSEPTVSAGPTSSGSSSSEATPGN